MRRRLKLLEEENIALKRERNELTLQLLGTRSELSMALRGSGGGSGANPQSVAESGMDASHGAAQGTTADEAVKIIELENKLAIASKKEVEYKMLFVAVNTLGSSKFRV
jgi:hypothetical protein